MTDFFVDVDGVGKIELNSIIERIKQAIIFGKMEVYSTSDDNYCLKVFGSPEDLDFICNMLRSIVGVDQHYIYFTKAKGEFNRRVSRRVINNGTVKDAPRLIDVVEG